MAELVDVEFNAVTDACEVVVRRGGESGQACRVASSFGQFDEQAEIGISGAGVALLITASKLRLTRAGTTRLRVAATGVVERG